MTLFSTMMIFPILLFLAIALAHLFLALWTYNDAKNKNLNPIMWTLIVLLVPNLLGLLLYFLVGRSQEVTICNFCNSRIPAKSNYCPSCGNQISSFKLAETKSGKKYIIAFIISMSIIFILGIAFVVNIFSNNFDSIIGATSVDTYSIGCIETNIGNTWKVSFVESNDTFRKSITIDEDGPKSLSIESYSNEGTAYLHLYKDGISLNMIELTPNFETKDFDLTQYGNGKISFELKSGDASKFKFKGIFK